MPWFSLLCCVLYVARGVWCVVVVFEWDQPGRVMSVWCASHVKGQTVGLGMP